MQFHTEFQYDPAQYRRAAHDRAYFMTLQNSDLSIRIVRTVRRQFLYADMWVMLGVTRVGLARKIERGE